MGTGSKEECGIGAGRKRLFGKAELCVVAHSKCGMRNSDCGMNREFRISPNSEFRTPNSPGVTVVSQRDFCPACEMSVSAKAARGWYRRNNESGSQDSFRIPSEDPA